MSSLASVLEHLKSGGVIAYPTEGVWGFGCDPNNQDAINNLLKQDVQESVPMDVTLQHLSQLV